MPTLTKKKALNKGCQVAPAVEAAAAGHWPPKGGTEYHVEDGDNWGKLAERWKIKDVRNLLWFNFRTVTPTEVNWYLDRYVGCVLRTKDACNWRFSSDATPGLIYRPWDWYPEPKDRGGPVIVLPPYDPDPLKDEPTRLPPVSDYFSIRMVWGNGLGVKTKGKVISRGVTLDSLFFEVTNMKNMETAVYRYTGLGLGVSLNLPVTITENGPPNYFHTSSPILETDFGGFTRFTSASVYNQSVNMLHLCGTPSGVNDVYLDQFKTGNTYGAAIGFSLGDLVLMD